MRKPITAEQAAYLRELALAADIAGNALQVALRALALAIGDKGKVNYELGPEPWIEVVPGGPVEE